MNKNEQSRFHNTEYFISRELSWLEFNDRVLQEARNKANPLLERTKFLSIVSSNLDEFFMVRVGSLKDQINAGYKKPDSAGLTPKHQLKAIAVRAHSMVHDQYNLFRRTLLPALAKGGIAFAEVDQLTQEQEAFVETYFSDYIYPVLSPMAVDSSRPFPLILNRSLNLGTIVQDKKNKNQMFATVQIPSVLPRLVEIPGEGKQRVFLLLEEIVKKYIGLLFTGHRVLFAFPYRITRNADLSIDEEEAEDLLLEIEKSLKKRKTGRAVRLEVEQHIAPELLKILQEELEITPEEIYFIPGPLDLRFLMQFNKLADYSGLMYPEFSPVLHPRLTGIGSGGKDMFAVINEGDILLHHPYDSFEPVVDFIRKAVDDPAVLAIKQTLYRVSGDSPIVAALADGAEKGKQVTVLVELKARFDEEQNIQWAKRLEESGCHVIYGLVGLKTHCKITLVVRMEDGGIKRYVHLGTGNYNDATARLYTDMGLLTSREQFGADASAIFNRLTGYSELPDLYKLDIAPTTLRNKVLSLINRERENALAGGRGRIIAKMNSLVDSKIIEALYAASSAGVDIDLIVRGICCLRPGLPNVSANIRVTSIVGRFLEHSRIFYFANMGAEEVLLSSADWMPRNLDRRIELLFPVEDSSLRQQVIQILYTTLRDSAKAKILTSTGAYRKVDRRSREYLDSQEYLMAQALSNQEVAATRDMSTQIKPGIF